MVLICISLMISLVWHLFMCLLAIYMSFSRKIPIQSLSSILIEFSFCLFLMLIYMSSLYVLDIHSLSDVSFANIFSHSVVCHLFVLLIVSFAVQKLFSLLVLFIYFCFVSLAWRNKSKKMLLRSVSETILTMFSVFSCRNFMVSGLTFKSFIQFEFIFVYCVRK